MIQRETNIYIRVQLSFSVFEIAVKSVNILINATLQRGESGNAHEVQKEGLGYIKSGNYTHYHLYAKIIVVKLLKQLFLSKSD